MPKIVTKRANTSTGTQKFEKTEHPWRISVIDSDWKEVKKYYFCKENIFIHPAPKSRSSDFFFNLTNNSVLAFAVKNYPSTTFTFTTLQEEIDKAWLMMQDSTFIEVCLFVFCYGIERSAVQNYCTNDGCLVLNEGVYDFGQVSKTISTISTIFCPDLLLVRGTPKNISSYTKNHHPSRICVPNGLQVIVLGRELFESFFTKQDYEILKEVSSKLPNADVVRNMVSAFSDAVFKMEIE